MSVNTNAHFSTDKNLKVMIKSDIVNSVFPFSYHMVEITGSKGTVSLYLSVDQMVKLHQALGLGINRAEKVERKLQQEKSEEEVNG